MIKAVIFDMDGVLIDTEKYLVKYWCQAAAEAGFDMKYEHGLMLRSLAMKFAERKLHALFGNGFDYRAVRDRRRELMQLHLAENGVEKKPGADVLLAYLKAEGYKTAVATATDEERTGHYLTQIGLLDYFDHIVCAPMVENGKPFPDIYLYACSQLKEQPKHCLALEDSPNGVLSAYRAGCRVVMVTDLTEPDEETEKMLCGVAHGLQEAAHFITLQKFPLFNEVDSGYPPSLRTIIKS